MSQFEKNIPPRKKKSDRTSYERPKPNDTRKNETEKTQTAQAKRDPLADEAATKAGTEKSAGGKTGPVASGAAEKAVKKKKTNPWKVAGIAIAIVVLAAVLTIVIAYAKITSEIAPEEGGYTPGDIGGIPEYTGEGVIHGLICGIDYNNENADGYEDEEHIGRTDMILYMRYDTINNKAWFLQIPRDTFVGPELNTGGTGKINALYYYSEDPNNRIEPLARCIYDQLGLPVDFYITIDMDAVKEIIDQPPGFISVYVPIDVMDPSDPNAVIPAGWRDFTSEEAEFFLRNRKSPTYNDQGDIMRLQMQQSFYSALYREFKELAPTDLLMWMRVILWRVNTDMDPMQLGGLAQKALNIQGSDITFVRPPVGVASYEGNSVLSLEPEGTAELLNEYFRPEGQEVSVDELNIYSLPMNVGVSEPSIRTMSDIQSGEEGQPEESPEARGEAA
ncbi:LCP family protein [Ruminococcaceae bacterium OttesenSCG-928-I18]|nr:LCP family protein [Ruminococcaceae bacterium OttesenSCG-928-I18]